MIMTTQAQASLDLSRVYPCPVCRHGTIQALVLTDAFACEFCRHILSMDAKQQSVQMVDNPQAIAWMWDGQRWRVKNSNRNASLSYAVASIAVILSVLPAGLVWLAGSLFPPLPSAPSQLSFSTIWALLTLIAHLSLVLWLIGEYYQFPFYVATKVRLLRQRLSSGQ